MTPLLNPAASTPRTMRPAAIAHAVAGTLAILLIAAFQLATLGVEVFGAPHAVAAVKRGIWFAIPALVLALAMAGGSGNWLARGKLLASGNASTVVKRKRRRMAFAAANGLLVLIPSAYLLQRWAGSGSLDGAFYTVQALELVAGWINLALLVRNALDGRKLAGRGRR